MNIVIFGAPASGKGTQAKLISQKLDVVHVSSGDLFREQIQKDTMVGRHCVDTMNAGGLITDQITKPLVQLRLAMNDAMEKGVILDGYPRNMYQVSTLDDVINKVDVTVVIDLDEKLLVQRIAGRRACTKCGATYNIYDNAPKVEGVCDVCGDALIKRKDDEEDIVKERINIYHTETAPILSELEKVSKVKRFDGNKDIEVLNNEIVEYLKGL